MGNKKITFQITLSEEAFEYLLHMAYLQYCDDEDYPEEQEKWSGEILDALNKVKAEQNEQNQPIE